MTPPGRLAHTFTYTALDLTASYTPPVVSGTGSTGYLFNVDRQPTEVQRPDGQTTLFNYGPANGRLNSVTFSRGSLNYGYDTAGRVLTLSDPGGVNLGYLYDGALLLRETWSGGLTGQVSRTFDNDFGVLTELVNNLFSVTFTYDGDRLLTGRSADDRAAPQRPGHQHARSRRPRIPHLQRIRRAHETDGHRQRRTGIRRTDHPR